VLPIPWVRRGVAGLEWWIDMRIIERARILRGWTRRDLAHVARVDSGTISDMLAGRRRPTFGTVRAVTAALGLELADMITFEIDRLEWPAAG
jgi:transcriptional regulator with XRE-family HTH domain